MDVQEIRAQLAFNGSLPALREIRLAVILSRKVHLKITNLLATSDACGAFIYNSVWIREPFIFRRLIPTYFSKHTLFAASFFLNAKDRKTASVECSEVGVGRGWSNAFLFPHSLVFLFFFTCVQFFCLDTSHFRLENTSRGLCSKLFMEVSLLKNRTTFSAPNFILFFFKIFTSDVYRS